MNQQLIAKNLATRSKSVPELRPGDVVRIQRKIVESGKERIQAFQGMVIAIKGGQSSSPMITVRKISFGIGVELILPLYAPAIESIELVKRTHARRAKLYYVRTKAARTLGKKLREVGIKPTAKGESAEEAIPIEGEVEPAEVIDVPESAETESSLQGAKNAAVESEKDTPKA